MVERLQQRLSSLYEQDETAWLEVMSELAAHKRFEEMDCENLSEYLQSMARRDKREVYSRLRILLTHLLKWEYQAEQRGKSWSRTILAQRSELRQLFQSGTLKRHAGDVLADVYQEAVEAAAAETGLPKNRFPKKCPRSLDELLSEQLD